MNRVVTVWAAVTRSRTRAGRLEQLPTALAVVAFAVTTWAVLAVAGGTAAFVGRSGAPGFNDTSRVYPVLAAISCALLIGPVSTLGAAAARLTMARRNLRLARMRLVGATNGQVTLTALLDAALEATVGAVAGVVLWVVTVPALAQLRFQGRTFALHELYLPAPLVLLVVVAVLSVALLSCLVSLMRVAVTPLGVARRVPVKALSSARVLPVLAAALAFAAMVPVLLGNADIIFGVTVLLLLLSGAFLAMNIVGPWLVGTAARLVGWFTSSPVTLLAARRLAADPKSGWRGVGGLALVVVVAGCLTIAPGIATEASLGSDVVAGGLTTLGIAALLAAVSTGVTQATRVLDQAGQYRALHLGGADPATLAAARVREVALSLAVTVGGATALTVILVWPFSELLGKSGAGAAMLFIGTVLGSVALIVAAVLASSPLVHAVARPQAQVQAGA